LGVRHEADNFILEKVKMLKGSMKDFGTKRKCVCHEESQGESERRKDSVKTGPLNNL
jgi:hypothetical protein